MKRFLQFWIFFFAALCILSGGMLVKGQINLVNIIVSLNSLYGLVVCIGCLRLLMMTDKEIKVQKNNLRSLVHS